MTLTRRAVPDYLAKRHARWPSTANRHLFVSRHTVHETGPASDWWCHMRFQGLSVTLERLRIDRQLKEALAADADPLHLAAVFGVSETTALRDAASACRSAVASVDGTTMSSTSGGWSWSGGAHAGLLRPAGRRVRPEHR